MLDALDRFTPQSWSEPQRQSPVAAIFILLKFLKRAIRALFPLIVLILVQSKDNFMIYLLSSLLVFLLVQVIFSLLAYFRYYFYVKGSELVIEKGIFKKTKLNLPFDRIQTINFEQNLLHQLLGVVQLKIDTAGSANAEMNIDALSKQKAEQLRNFILQQKAETAPRQESELSEGETEVVAASTEDHVVFRLQPQDLLKVGVSQNHLRTGGLILASIFGLLQFLPEEYTYREVARYATEAIGIGLDLGWAWIVVFFILFLLISFLASLVRTVLDYFDLQLRYNEKGFKLIAGLLNRQEQSASHNKIQFIRWDTDPLKKLFDLHT
ncbi:MAG: PH domain-containing protein, partial [Bacteroidota bacterium]